MSEKRDAIEARRVSREIEFYNVVTNLIDAAANEEAKRGSDLKRQLFALYEAESKDYASLLRVAEAARELLADLSHVSTGYDQDQNECGDMWTTETDCVERLEEALAALPAPGERKAGG